MELVVFAALEAVVSNGVSVRVRPPAPNRLIEELVYSGDLKSPTSDCRVGSNPTRTTKLKIHGR